MRGASCCHLAVILFMSGCASLSSSSESPSQAERASTDKAVVRDEGPQHGHRIEAAVEAMRDGDYEVAHLALLELSSACPATSELGYRALLLSASADLDPRNPEGQMDRGVGSIATALAANRVPAWAEPVAETLYLLALNMGAAPPAGPTQSGESADSAGSTQGNRETVAAATEGVRVAPRTSRLNIPMRYLPTKDGPGPCGPLADPSTFASFELPELPLAPLVLQIAILEQEKARLNERSTELATEITRLEEEIKRIRSTIIP